MEGSSVPWVEKYRAKSFDRVYGQKMAADRIKSFIREFPKKRAAILHGPPGVGKTTLAYVLASELNAEILELNASDLRDKERVSMIIGPASVQKPLFRKFKVVLVDEVDGISSTRDKGGLAELLGIIEKSAYPIIITANDIWQKKFNLLRKKSQLIELKSAGYKDVLRLLLDICKTEGINFPYDALKAVAVKSRGDFRAAINDLQAMAERGEGEDYAAEGERDKEKSIFEALRFVFKNAQINDEMIRVFSEVDMPVDEIFLWVEENLPLEYKGVELAKALEALSIADVFRGRIRRQRHWRFLVYENFFLGPAIASAKKSNREGWTNYKKPTRILKIWLQNQRAAKKRSICEKYSRACHISSKTAMKDFMLIKMILKNPRIRAEIGLSQDEIDYLDKPL